MLGTGRVLVGGLSDTATVPAGGHPARKQPMLLEYNVGPSPHSAAEGNEPTPDPSWHAFNACVGTRPGPSLSSREDSTAVDASSYEASMERRGLRRPIRRYYYPSWSPLLHQNVRSRNAEKDTRKEEGNEKQTTGDKARFTLSLLPRERQAGCVGTEKPTAPQQQQLAG